MAVAHHNHDMKLANVVSRLPDHFPVQRDSWTIVQFNQATAQDYNKAIDIEGEYMLLLLQIVAKESLGIECSDKEELVERLSTEGVPVTIPTIVSLTKRRSDNHE